VKREGKVWKDELCMVGMESGVDLLMEMGESMGVVPVFIGREGE